MYTLSNNVVTYLYTGEDFTSLFNMSLILYSVVRTKFDKYDLVLHI